VQTGLLVTITPAPSGPNTAIVSDQVHNGATMVDVSLNGVDNFFSPSQVGFVYDRGASTGGAQTFENSTSLHTIFWGGSGANLDESTGTGADEFIGGSGSNTFATGLGFDLLIGGSGPNVYTENSAGSGEFVETGSNNTVNGNYPSYTIYP
jgi:Ca2+-binding RTX toxin-like protein